MEGHNPHELEAYFPYFFSGDNFIIHYTCNAPSCDVLLKHKITSIGKTFGCKDDREVLKIPVQVCIDRGYHELNDREILRINLENILKTLK